MEFKLIPPGHPFEDFRNFIYAKWKFLGLPDPTPIQYDIAHYMQWGPERSIIEAYRGAGKSFLAAGYSEWRWLDDVNDRIMVVSGGKERADAFSQFCLQSLRSWDAVEHLQPRKDQRKSLAAFDVNGAEVDQSPSCKSVGITGQLTGSRADVIIPDDVETPKNTLTQTQRERLEVLVTEFESVIKNANDSPKRKIMYLGTPQVEDTLYNKLAERGYDLRIWPARKPTAVSVPEKYGNHLAPYIMDLDIPEHDPVDPKRFTDEDLLQREAIYGATGFALQFQLDTSLEDELKYPLKCRDFIVMDIDREVAPVKVTYGSSEDQKLELPCGGLKGDRWHGPMYVSDQHTEYAGSVLYIDPSGRGKDRTGFAVVKHLNGMLYVRRAGSIDGGYDEDCLLSLAHIARAEKVNLVQTESNFGDGMFESLLKPVLNRVYPCSVEERKVTGQKELRIIDTIEPLLNQHRVVIDKQVIVSDSTEPLHHSLQYQLSRLTKERQCLGHDDALDALEGALAYWVEKIDHDINDEDLEERHRIDAIHEEVDKWMEEMTGRKGHRNSSFISNV